MNPSYVDPGYGGAVVAAAIGLAVFGVILGLAAYVVGSWFLMKVFDKAGVQGRWRAWVPIYNTLIFVKLGDLNPWWLLALWGGGIVLGWVPGLNYVIGLAAFVYTLLAAWRVGLKLQKEAVWLVLYFFLYIVWLGIAAFDSSRWNTAIPAAPWARNFLADKTVWAGIPSQVPVGGYPANPVMQPGYPAPGAYPPAGYQPPSTGYAPPPAGYGQPPVPPAGYTQPPAGYTPPAAPPAGYGQPPVPPAGYTPPPAGYAQPPAPPAGYTPPPAGYTPAATQPPAAPEPPTAPVPPAAPEPPAPPAPAPEPPAAEPPAPPAAPEEPKP